MAEINLRNRRVLVTGSGTGIGKGIAKAFLREGASVVFHYGHHFDDDAAAALDQAESQGLRVTKLSADFNDIDSAVAMTEQAINFLGGIDVLINNAGITLSEPFASVTPKQYNILFNVNVRALYFITQAAVRKMIAQGGGNVINLASLHAYQGHHEHSIYAATKGAIVSLTRALAVELGPSNIRVNAIAPGHVPTENHERIDANQNLAQAARTKPLGRLGTADDLANLALFLCSDMGSYITGQTYVCDGGQFACMAATDAFRFPLKQKWGSMYLRDEHAKKP